MISIVICSAKSFLLEQVKLSIAATIVVPYELIVIDNTANQYSIATAYNEGGRQAKFDYLLFVHEDVLFKTHDWGTKFIHHLDNLANAGIIGIAGGRYKSRIPSLWAVCDPEAINLHLMETSKKTGVERHIQENSTQPQPVYVLDGVFLGMRKSSFLVVQFDEKLPGFHQYDVDICIAASQHFTNYFIPDILVHHFSEGSPEETWIRNGMYLFYKWKKVLPLNWKDHHRFDPRVEVGSFDDFLIRLFGSKLPLREKLQYSTVVYGYVLEHGKGVLSATRILLKKWGKLLLKGRSAWAA